MTLRLLPKHVALFFLCISVVSFSISIFFDRVVACRRSTCSCCMYSLLPPLCSNPSGLNSRVWCNRIMQLQRGGGNNARGERDGGDADADGDGDGRKGRGLIGREVTRVPPLPSSLPSFYIYISCVVKRTETSYLKMGGARELDHWMDHLVLGQEAFSLLLASSHCIIILLAMCFCIIDLSAGSSHAPSDPVSLFMIHPSITH